MRSSAVRYFNSLRRYRRTWSARKIYGIIFIILNNSNNHFFYLIFESEAPNPCVSVCIRVIRAITDNLEKVLFWLMQSARKFNLIIVIIYEYENLFWIILC